MYKKLLAMLTVFAMVFALAACGGEKSKDASSASTGTESTVVEDSAKEDVTSQDKSEATDGKEDDKKEEGSKTTTTTQTAPQGGNTNTTSTENTNSGSITIVTGDKYSGNGGSNEPTGDGAGNQSGQANITAAYDNIKIKSGKSVTEGLNFGGKTFTMAITEEGQYHTASFKRTITAFEKKYNCKIKTVQYAFNEYNKQITQAIASGKAPEICYAHGSMFPACAIDNLYNPLNDHIVQADLMDNNNPTAGGIDLAKTSYFVYKGKIYGTCNYSSVFPVVIYYNKVAMTDKGYSGAKDPRKLAENGQWSWNRIIQMGKQLTDKSDDVYFLSNGFSGRSIMLAYGAPIITNKNGVYKENVSSTGYIAGLNLIKQLFVGANSIAEPRGNDGAYPYNSYDRMLKGKTYMFTEETSKYLDMAKDVATSNAFERKKSNIGITTMPLGNTNTKKLYPTGWLTAVCSGKGSDERVAIAWETFRSSYVDPVTDANAMSATDKAFCDSLIKGGISCEVGNFHTSSDDAVGIMMGAGQSVTNGADVAQTIESVKKQVANCIASTVK